MRFMRRTAKYALMDYKRLEDIQNELKTDFILDKLSKYKNVKIQRVNRMKRDKPQGLRLKPLHPQCLKPAVIATLVWWPGVKNSPNVAHACRKRRLK
jgi:hypothetical protein